MPVVMANSLGQVTLNSSPILTTGVPVTVGNASTSAAPKLVIQALPTMLPASSKAGEKITIITIPANQLATLMQANTAGQVTQLIQAKHMGTQQLPQAGAKAAATAAGSTPAVQLTAGRSVPQLILAKPAAVAQPLPQIQMSRPPPGPPKTPSQPQKPSERRPQPQPQATQSEAAEAEAPPSSSPVAASADSTSS